MLPTVITQTTYQRITQQKTINSLEPSDLRLRSYSGDNVQVYGVWSSPSGGSLYSAGM